VFLLEDGVVNVKHGTAGITENVLYAFFFQTTDDDFCAGEFHDGILSKSTGN
jgi:hypothetical protein